MATFTGRGANVCFVELEAAQAERLRRNETPLRLLEKGPQRDIAGSRAFLLDADQRYQLNTRGTFFYPDQHLKIDNTALEPEVVARPWTASGCHWLMPVDVVRHMSTPV